MSKQTKASERWKLSQRMAKIGRLQQQALDYSHPAGQAQAGIQLASVEVPWLLAHIEELKEQINVKAQEQTVAA